MMTYFAYGANMSALHMRRCCPGAACLGAARLDGWRFLITRDGYASIARRPGGGVHGVLWRLSPRHLAALDVYENVRSGLYRRCPVAVRHGGRPVRALTYVARTREPGRPRPGYQDGMVVPAASAWGLPAAYLEELRSWCPERPRSVERSRGPA